MSDHVGKSCNFMEGKFAGWPRNSADPNRPVPLGWLTLPSDRVTYGTKTHHGNAASETASSSGDFPKKGAVGSEMDNIHPQPTKYKIYSQEGLAFPLGKHYHPPGYGNTISGDLDNNKVSAFSRLECWFITWGNDSLYKFLPANYVTNSILPPTTPSLQRYLIQLALGVIGTASADASRVGSSVRKYSCVYPGKLASVEFSGGETPMGKKDKSGLFL